MSQVVSKASVEQSQIREQEHTEPEGVVRNWSRWLVGTIPTALVMAALAGIAYWGHSNGWKIPKASALSGASTEKPDDWCIVHNVPESECIECIPALLPSQTDYGWCKEHGVHQCPLCHPDVAQLKETPRIEPSILEAASFALQVRDRQENNLGCTLYRNRVQFATIEAVRKAGIEIELADTKPVTESISANGEITYDGTRVAHLASRLSGTIWRVEKNVGEKVRKGEVLALVDAADVGKAKAELLDSLAQVDFHATTVARLKPLHEKQVITGTRMLEADTAMQQANIRLRRAKQALANLGMHVSLEEFRRMSESERDTKVRFLGLPSGLIAQLSSETISNNLVPLVASLDGVVTRREAVVGEVVDPTETLFELADTSQMWVRFNVALEDARYLMVGQAVQFQPDGTRASVYGAVSWISTDVDKQTRTVEVRAEVGNPNETLRNETFGVGEIVLRKVEQAVVVPQSAVQWDGTCFVAFVRDRNYFDKTHPKIFHTRTVRPGVTKDGFTEIIAGILPGEVVVTDGSSVLRSQILKNNLGAGCTCGH